MSDIELPSKFLWQLLVHDKVGSLGRLYVYVDRFSVTFTVYGIILKSSAKA